MRFQICIKQVPDVTAPVHTGRMVLNAYDASAVEAALVLTARDGGEIALVSIGPDGAAETIRKALAMGADAATHLVTDAEGLDSAAYARLLADHLQEADYDVVLCGKQAQDTDAGLTGAMLAEHLGLPYATNAVGLDVVDGKVRVTRQGDSGQEIIDLPTPCLVTCSNDMNDPRIPSLKGIMAAKRKKIDARPVDAAPAPRVEQVRYEDVPARPSGQLLEGEPEELAQQLRARLADEAKVL